MGCDYRRNYSFADGTSWVAFIVSILFGQFTGRFQSAVVDRLENLLVELLSLGALERVAHEDERVGQTLDADADRTVSHIGSFRLHREISI